MLHTITLITTKRILSDNDFIKLAIQLIENKLVKVDYFGIEPDNQADYINAEMQDKIDNNTFINIYFEREKIEYNTFSEAEILQLAIIILSDPIVGSRIEVNENEIDIFI